MKLINLFLLFLFLFHSSKNLEVNKKNPLVLLIQETVCDTVSCNSIRMVDFKDKPLLKFDDFAIHEQYISGDTLVICSGSPFLFYPLGKFINSKEFAENYNYWKLKEKLISDAGAELHYYEYGRNKLTYYYDPEDYTNTLDILAAYIYDDDIIFQNNIRIGVDKVNLINCFTDINDVKFEEIKIIKLVFGLYGIWHYYFFEEDILTSIIIKNGYTIEMNGNRLIF